MQPVSEFSKALKVLNLWNRNDSDKLSREQLWTRKEELRRCRPVPALAAVKKRAFDYYLACLVEEKYLRRERNPDTGNWTYVKTDKFMYENFALLFADFTASRYFYESRDILGASLVVSQPALTDFLTQKDIKNIYMTLDKANRKVATNITEAFIQKRIEELPDKEKVDACEYQKNKPLFDETRHRLELSGKVATKDENEEVTTKLLLRARLLKSNTVEELRAKVGWRFNRMMKDIPLTFYEYEEYRKLERKVLPLKKFFEKIEDQVPKFLCCFWNFEMEEYFLEKHALVLCIDDILRPIEEVIDSLSRIKMLEYKKNLEKAVRSGTFRMPRWTGNDNRFQPKLRISWDDKTSRKYLRRILLNIDYRLGVTRKQKSRPR